jgi:hypothetical protein
VVDAQGDSNSDENSKRLRVPKKEASMDQIEDEIRRVQGQVVGKKLLPAVRNVFTTRKIK